ncbi:hypothetical protein J7399_20430 [Shimia sp. R9_1]|uniref:hypothetical protein n=1 Tax=Shimia sp. R9_1 TaxID=2821111 RepID=UPI001ADC89AC|nr:hypothetical protein [Shimia sp. R9_1]MBO9409810.1 hypothetical protein [Shimia sp. R9_1]
MLSGKARQQGLSCGRTNLIPNCLRDVTMYTFQSPGRADPDVSDAVLAVWNDTILDKINSHKANPFLVTDPSQIADGKIAHSIKWPANPREPLDCLGEELAVQLSDWGWPGRAELHNEYLEYALIMRPDSDGNLRPKRFIATTELMEWWQAMAVHDLPYFLQCVTSITGRRYEAEELFGISEQQWNSLTVKTRTEIFRRRLVGFGRAQPPEHPLNMEHVLFMAENINGLSDLIFVVHFGSFPYAVNQDGKRRRAKLEEIFLSVDREDLYCRNADTGAAQAAYDQVFLRGKNPPQGRVMAFANPLGVYLRALRTKDLSLDGEPVPQEWGRFSRGTDGMMMRLEFGPGDEDPHFLDDLLWTNGARTSPVSGYLLARLIEVGPLVVIGDTPRPIANDEFRDIPTRPCASITRGLPSYERCKQIATFADQYENPLGVVPGTRGLRES